MDALANCYNPVRFVLQPSGLLVRKNWLQLCPLDPAIRASPVEAHDERTLVNTQHDDAPVAPFTACAQEEQALLSPPLPLAHDAGIHRDKLCMPLPDTGKIPVEDGADPDPPFLELRKASSAAGVHVFFSPFRGLLPLAAIARRGRSVTYHGSRMSEPCVAPARPPRLVVGRRTVGRVPFEAQWARRCPDDSGPVLSDPGPTQELVLLTTHQSRNGASAQSRPQASGLLAGSPERILVEATSAYGPTCQVRPRAGDSQAMRASPDPSGEFPPPDRGTAYIGAASTPEWIRDTRGAARSVLPRGTEPGSAQIRVLIVVRLSTTRRAEPEVVHAAAFISGNEYERTRTSDGRADTVRIWRRRTPARQWAGRGGAGRQSVPCVCTVDGTRGESEYSKDSRQRGCSSTADRVFSAQLGRPLPLARERWDARTLPDRACPSQKAAGGAPSGTPALVGGEKGRTETEVRSAVRTAVLRASVPASSSPTAVARTVQDRTRDAYTADAYRHTRVSRGLEPARGHKDDRGALAKIRPYGSVNVDDATPARASRGRVQVLGKHCVRACVRALTEQRKTGYPGRREMQNTLLDARQVPLPPACPPHPSSSPSPPREDAAFEIDARRGVEGKEGGGTFARARLRGCGDSQPSSKIECIDSMATIGRPASNAHRTLNGAGPETPRLSRRLAPAHPADEGTGVGRTRGGQEAGRGRGRGRYDGRASAPVQRCLSEPGPRRSPGGQQRTEKWPSERTPLATLRGCRRTYVHGYVHTPLQNDVPEPLTPRCPALRRLRVCRGEGADSGHAGGLIQQRTKVRARGDPLSFYGGGSAPACAPGPVRTDNGGEKRSCALAASAVCAGVFASRSLLLFLLFLFLFGRGTP
ncbi:uncharacterized protein FIBRA_00159 [Fibroporia radiculosa]|uniref:Uncharacterized protein n=1 Tax=Fibroporia radiculosa TaxID=599839 RepID=J7RV27_9APHY|nr:uncharacterized protein FIBRA_00159 [Fibroporia radiculosa]CCL98165.1 predicted protein [Fibroporia radiculosa]